MSTHSWFFKFLGCLVKRKINVKISLAPMKILTNSEECSGEGSRIIIFVPAFPSATGRFSPLFTPHWMQEKSAKIYMT
jgi:hypothetical protein